eukprot:Rmarinus@m.27530
MNFFFSAFFSIFDMNNARNKSDNEDDASSIIDVHQNRSEKSREWWGNVPLHLSRGERTNAIREHCVRDCDLPVSGTSGVFANPKFAPGSPSRSEYREASDCITVAPRDDAIKSMLFQIQGGVKEACASTEASRQVQTTCSSKIASVSTVADADLDVASCTEKLLPSMPQEESEAFQNVMCILKSVGLVVDPSVCSFVFESCECDIGATVTMLQTMHEEGSISPCLSQAPTKIRKKHKKRKLAEFAGVTRVGSIRESSNVQDEVLIDLTVEQTCASPPFGQAQVPGQDSSSTHVVSPAPQFTTVKEKGMSYACVARSGPTICPSWPAWCETEDQLYVLDLFPTLSEGIVRSTINHTRNLSDAVCACMNFSQDHGLDVNRALPKHSPDGVRAPSDYEDDGLLSSSRSKIECLMDLFPKIPVPLLVKHLHVNHENLCDTIDALCAYSWADDSASDVTSQGCISSTTAWRDAIYDDKALEHLRELRKVVPFASEEDIEAVLYFSHSDYDVALSRLRTVFSVGEPPDSGSSDSNKWKKQICRLLESGEDSDCNSPTAQGYTLSPTRRRSKSRTFSGPVDPLAERPAMPTLRELASLPNHEHGELTARQRVLKHQRLRDYHTTASKRAWHAGKGAEAKRLSNLAWEEDRKAREATHAVMHETLARMDGSSVMVLDLHMYRAKTVDILMREILQDLPSSPCRNADKLRVITGRGEHSVNKDPVLRPLVHNLLTQYHTPAVWEDKLGSVLIDLRSMRQGGRVAG